MCLAPLTLNIPPMYMITVTSIGCLHFSLTKRTFADIKTYCLSLGMKMFYVNSEEELLEGQSLMKAITVGMEESGKR